MDIANKIKEIIELRRQHIEKDLNYFNSIKNELGFKREKLSTHINDKLDISIISEIKPASPTLGRIRKKVNVKNIAKEMESAGVIGLSILTEPHFFNGSYENLKCALESTRLPCLMKDFVVDEIQLKIAQQIGATNILLINSIIDLWEFYPLCLRYDLEPLIEIHDVEEIRDIKRLIEVGFDPILIGVNNRNLKTMEVNLHNSLNIIPKVREELGKDTKVVSESGYTSFHDIKMVQSSGADAFLIGSSIMQSKNIKKKIFNLRGMT